DIVTDIWISKEIALVTSTTRQHHDKKSSQSPHRKQDAHFGIDGVVFARNCSDDNDDFHKFGVLEATAPGIRRMIVGWAEDHLQIRVCDGTSWHRIPCPRGTKFKSQHCKRSVTSDENGAFELVFYERTKSETNAKLVNHTDIMVNIFIFTYGYNEALTVSVKEKNVVFFDQT
ncbi:unnamed protein product, partial [Hymenolepis diminuta]